MQKIHTLCQHAVAFRNWSFVKKQLGSQILTWFLNLIQNNNRETIQQLSTDCFPSQLEIEQYFKHNALNNKSQPTL